MVEEGSEFFFLTVTHPGCCFSGRAGERPETHGVGLGSAGRICRWLNPERRRRGKHEAGRRWSAATSRGTRIACGGERRQDGPVWTGAMQGAGRERGVAHSPAPLVRCWCCAALCCGAVRCVDDVPATRKTQPDGLPPPPPQRRFSCPSDRGNVVVPLRLPVSEAVAVVVARVSIRVCCVCVCGVCEWTRRSSRVGYLCCGLLLCVVSRRGEPVVEGKELSQWLNWGDGTRRASGRLELEKSSPLRV